MLSTELNRYSSLNFNIDTILNTKANDVLIFMIGAQCLKITQNVAFEFLNFDIFHQFLSNLNFYILAFSTNFCPF